MAELGDWAIKDQLMGVIFFAVLGIALLMIIHEAGHYFAARSFGLKVIRFSIGFGPAIWRYRSRKTGTIFQVALIPFFAFVQVAGMNPFEEIDPDDESSYANASLFARITTIVAGPLANYLFASVFFFGSFYIGGDSVPTLNVQVMKDGAAAQAKMRDGDKITRIGKQRIEDFEQLRSIVLKNADRPLEFEVDRNGKRVVLQITPLPKGEGGQGLIGVTPIDKRVPMAIAEAARRSVIAPALFVRDTMVTIGRIVTRQIEPQLAGPVGIGQQLGIAAERGIDIYLRLLGLLSAYLGAFNMLPYPALDGGRFVFLTYEAVTRRKPNARLEASIHTVGLLTLLALITVVTVKEVGSFVTGPSDEKATADEQAPKKPVPKGQSTKP
jgi:regulator of sigma E protease